MPTDKTRNAEEVRKRREANALAIVKAMRPHKAADKVQLDPARPRPDRAELDEIQRKRHTHIDIRPGASGVVYFIYSANRIKIGYTTDVARRVSEIGTCCPFPVTLLLTVTGDEETEKEFHDLFESEREHLEWFRPRGDLDAFLWHHLCDDGHNAWADAMTEYAISEHPYEFTGYPKELEETP